MPRIDDLVLDAFISLYASVADARQGVGDELGGASGFLVGVRSERHPRYTFVYAVTNAHVVEDRSCAYPVVRLSLPLGVKGPPPICALTPDDWTLHPAGDDLAVALIDFVDQDLGDLGWLPEHLFVTRDFVEDTKIGAGEDTFAAVRLRGHDGRNRNLPTVVSGAISLMPLEPVWHRGREQEAYLVETRSLSGFSGAPVFVHRSDEKMPLPSDRYPIEKREFREPFEGHRLLGVDCGHFPLYDKLRIKRASGELEETPGDMYSISNSGHMIVAPAWRLRDLLYHAPLVQARLQREDEVPGTPTTAN